MKISDRLTGRTSQPQQNQQQGQGHGGHHQQQGGGAGPDVKQIMGFLHNEVIDRLDMARVKDLDAATLHQHVGSIVHDLLTRQHIVLADPQRDRIVQSIVDELIGLGPIESLLGDSTISDILINGSQQVFVERGGVGSLVQLLNKKP